MSIVTITGGHGNGDPGAVNGQITEALRLDLGVKYTIKISLAPSQGPYHNITR